MVGKQGSMMPLFQFIISKRYYRLSLVMTSMHYDLEWVRHNIHFPSHIEKGFF